MTNDTFDYAVLGRSVRSIIATRLSELSNVKFVFWRLALQTAIPLFPAGRLHQMIFNPNYTWQFRTEPSEQPGDAPSRQQGRGLGGSGAINGMVYNRGQAADFDNWLNGATRAGTTTAYCLISKSESWAGRPGRQEFHGTDGPAKITERDWFHPVCEAFMDGVEHEGIPRNDDYNGKLQEGVGYFQRFIHKGRRHNPANAYLSGFETRKHRPTHRCAGNAPVVRGQKGHRRGISS